MLLASLAALGQLLEYARVPLRDRRQFRVALAQPDRLLPEVRRLLFDLVDRKVWHRLESHSVIVRDDPAAGSASRGARRSS